MDIEKLQTQGWVKTELNGFSSVLERMWVKEEGASLAFGFVLGGAHCNHHLKSAHGGVLLTFADVAIGRRVVSEMGGPYCATIQIQMQLLASAHQGEFIVCQPEVLRRTRDLVFARGLITVEDRIIASADGVWKEIRRERTDSEPPVSIRRIPSRQ